MADRVKWGPGRLDACKQFLDFDLRRALSARGSLELIWQNWLDQYRAPVSKGIASYPFEGASNITVPVTAMNVDPVLARWMRTIHAAPNVWTLSALNERWVDTAKPLQDYLEVIDGRILKMFDVNYRVFMETLKLGTGIYKTGWQFERRSKMGYDDQKQRARLIETINKPFVDHVPLVNFLLPPEAAAIEPDQQGGAQWVAERHRWRPSVLETMGKGQEPFLPNFDSELIKKVVKYEESSPTIREQTVADLDRLSISNSTAHNKPIEVWEVHARFDTTGDGVEDDIVVLFHLPSLSILRATYEPVGSRPYSAIRYLRGDGFYGVGIGEQAEVWQSVISRVLNFDIDKILLSNAPMLRVGPNANVVPDEPIFPGKQWHVGKDELEPFFLTAPGSFDIAGLRGYLGDQVKQRTGLTDLQFGSVGALPSRTPATTVQSLLQEGNTRLDLSIADLRESGLSEVGMRILQNLQVQTTDPLNNPEGGRYLQLAQSVLGQPEGQQVAQALTMPGEPIETGVGVRLTATSGTSNKELMKQSNLALMQIVTQMGPGFIELAQAAQMGGLVGQTAVQLFQGGAELLTRLLEQFDVRNPEEIVPSLQANLGALQSMAQGQPINPLAFGQGGGGPQGMAG